MKKEISIFKFVVVAGLLAGIGYWFMPRYEAPEYTAAQLYEIVRMSNDFSIPDRIRKTWIVKAGVWKAKAAEDTAKKAAIEIQKRTNPDVVQVFLINSDNEDNGIVSIFYAEDGKGNSGDQNWTWNIGYIDPSLE
jgi:hypothetical protein